MKNLEESKKIRSKNLDQSKKDERWKTFDVRTACGQDLNAAISMLCLIRDKPDIFDAVVKACEDYRERLIKAEEEGQLQAGKPITEPH